MDDEEKIKYLQDLIDKSQRIHSESNVDCSSRIVIYQKLMKRIRERSEHNNDNSHTDTSSRED